MSPNKRERFLNKYKNSIRKGNIGEMIGHFEILSLKNFFGTEVLYKPLFKIVENIDGVIKSGIDGIYQNILFKGNKPPPHKYLINEAKFNTAVLNKKVTKSGAKQMQEEWILYNLKRIKMNKKLRKDILEYGYDPVLTSIKKDGQLKYIKLLDGKAKIVKKIK